jgi:putative flavoprotein involved in K+ transport
MKIFETVIIGAGQAGLSLSYYLSQKDHEHILLEKASCTISNWRTRWDSFTIVLPNWTLKIPDQYYDGDNPDGFIDKNELIDRFERFTQTFKPKIHFNTQVTSLEKNGNNNHFVLQTNNGKIYAKNVVAAVGTFQIAYIPTITKRLSQKYTQLHTDLYRNPKDLPPGGVLVVGSGQSGAQIAEELNDAGRKVYLSTGKTKRFPRSYRGKDGVWWFNEMGFMDQTVGDLENSRMRFAANPIISGKNGGHDLDLHNFAKDGIQLLGRVVACDGEIVQIASDLYDNLSFQDEFVAQFKQSIDEYIEEKGMALIPKQITPKRNEGFDQPLIVELDLEKAGVSTIIWGTGYRFDYSWIHFPILDDDGYPITDRGATKVQGLYFIGLQWLWKRSSGLLMGIDEDAKYLAGYMEMRF